MNSKINKKNLLNMTVSIMVVLMMVFVIIAFLTFPSYVMASGQNTYTAHINVLRDDVPWTGEAVSFLLQNASTGATVFRTLNTLDGTVVFDNLIPGTYNICRFSTQQYTGVSFTIVNTDKHDIEVKFYSISITATTSGAGVRANMRGDYFPPGHSFATASSLGYGIRFGTGLRELPLGSKVIVVYEGSGANLYTYEWYDAGTLLPSHSSPYYIIENINAPVSLVCKVIGSNANQIIDISNIKAPDKLEYDTYFYGNDSNQMNRTLNLTGLEVDISLSDGSIINNVPYEMFGLYGLKVFYANETPALEERYGISYGIDGPMRITALNAGATDATVSVITSYSLALRHGIRYLYTASNPSGIGVTGTMSHSFGINHNDSYVIRDNEGFVNPGYLFDGWEGMAEKSLQYHIYQPGDIIEHVTHSMWMYARWRLDPLAPSLPQVPQVPSGSSGASGASAPGPAVKTITIDEGIKIEYTMLDTIVTLVIPQSKINEIIIAINKNNLKSLTFDISDIENSTGIVFPALAISKLSETSVSFNLVFPLGTLVLDSTNLTYIAEQTSTTDVIFSLNIIDQASLTAEQQKIVNDEDLVFDIEIRVGGKVLNSFPSELHIALHYDELLPVSIYHIDDGTIMEKLAFKFYKKEKTVAFTTKNLSVYIVGLVRNVFTDVNEQDWFFDGVMYCYAYGLMNGTSADIFNPNIGLSRGMVVTILYRKAGEPNVTIDTNPFTDVLSNLWYSDAIVWAVNEGIVNGYGDGRFGPNDSITKEQLSTILHRLDIIPDYMLKDGYDDSIYSDFNDISDYAKVAVSALDFIGAFQNIPINQDNAFQPKSTISRAEAAAIFHLFFDLVED
ncbi:MAG: S-layer homology domain-containing protein [Oscillospiraceae bacterium]|nr:S-layer homology domain-containing protein [Oscillospiraceae bacterium]